MTKGASTGFAFWLFGSVILASPADMVLRNGTVITMEESLPEASAIAISRDRIVWVGEEENAKDWIGEKTKVIDLAGAYVYPGFMDCHAHVRSLGLSHLQVDVTGTPDKESILKMVKERAEKTKKGEWVQGSGWDQNDWPEKKFPNAADLDSVSPDHPVALDRIDGHAIWVNSAALKLAGVSAKTADPDGGKIHRNAKGDPTGILIDNAMDLIYVKIPPLTVEQTIEATRLALQEAVQKGLTMIHDAGTYETDLKAWKIMVGRDELPARIYSMVWLPGEFGESLLKTGPQSHGPYLDVRAVKLVMDGAMGSRGAAMYEEYSDDPGNSGLIMWKEQELTRVLNATKAKGIQVGIHAIGDRANRQILDAFEKNGVKGLRWRIEHAQLLAPSDVPRFAAIDVIASMQPTHATSDMPWFADRVGPDRTKAGAYVWRSLLNHHTVIAGGSDAPVEDINPLWGIYAAITRQDHNGKPQGGWLPEQKVSRQEALRMFTVDAAYAAFRENQLGSIKAGKTADLTILPENLLTCDPKRMIVMKVLYTIVGGKIRYQMK